MAHHTEGILEQFGITDGCPGCEAKIEGKTRKHFQVCRARLEEAMKADEELKERIVQRNLRRGAGPEAEDEAKAAELFGNFSENDKME